jgi:hypothetical protein
MPFKKSAQHIAALKMVAENPTNPVSILLSGQSIIPEDILERMRKDQEKYNIVVPNETKPVIGDNVNTTIACYGSGSTSGWGSFPSSDTATFGGSGTEGVIQS